MKTRMRISILMLCAFAASFARAAEPKKLLVVSTTEAFRHDTIPTAETVLQQLADKSKAFTLDFIRQPEGEPKAPRRPGPTRPGSSDSEKQAAQDAAKQYAADNAAYQAAHAKWTEDALKPALAKLAPASLAAYDGVVFASTTGELPIPDRPGFLDWIKSGKAFIGIHAASDTFHKWPEFIDMLGGEFRTHGAQVGVDCINADPAHIATKMLPAAWKIDLEEVYQFKNYDPQRVHELLYMDKHPNDKTPGHYPVAWTRDYGQGRVFYTSLGHRKDIWVTDDSVSGGRKNPAATAEAYQAHLLGGILWAIGAESAAPAAKPNP